MLPASKAHEKIARRRIQPMIRVHSGLDETEGTIVPALFSIFSKDHRAKVSDFLNIDSSYLEQQVRLVMSDLLFRLYQRCMEEDQNRNERYPARKVKIHSLADLISDHSTYEYNPSLVDTFDPEIFYSYGALALVRIFENELNPYLEELQDLTGLDGDQVFELMAIFTPSVLYILSRALSATGEFSSKSGSLNIIQSLLEAYIRPRDFINRDPEQLFSDQVGDTLGQIDDALAVEDHEKAGTSDFNKRALSDSEFDHREQNSESSWKISEDSLSQMLLYTDPSLKSYGSYSSKAESGKMPKAGKLKIFFGVLLFLSGLVLMLFLLSSPSFRDEVFRFSLGSNTTFSNIKIGSGEMENGLTEFSGNGDKFSIVEGSNTVNSTTGSGLYFDNVEALQLDPGFKTGSMPEKVLSFIQSAKLRAPSEEYILSGIKFSTEIPGTITDSEDELFFLARILKLYPNVNLEIGENKSEKNSRIQSAALVRSMLSDLGIQRNRMFLVASISSEKNRSEKSSDTEDKSGLGNKDLKNMNQFPAVYIRIVSK
ncbi:MAG TPA: hypothetical protein PKA63_06200 [Oligoflexia bacterium]|nr:hypothetical protein [Oligoflexia bacterium]HMP48241.1 hypothetical protein [Oligoflexia bacterium]